MVPQLPVDVIIIIIENCITQKLYRLLFVNRLWFEITVPLLWKNPSTNSWKKISQTILSCCDSNIKQDLYKNGIIEKPKPPLFKYVAHVQILSEEIIESLTEGILEKSYEKGILDDTCYKLIRDTFWDLFMNSCYKLKSLNLPKNNSICRFRR